MEGGRPEGRPGADLKRAGTWTWRREGKGRRPRREGMGWDGQPADCRNKCGVLASVRTYKPIPCDASQCAPASGPPVTVVEARGDYRAALRTGPAKVDDVHLRFLPERERVFP